MRVKSAQFTLIIFYTLGLSVGCFHLPNLDLNWNIEVDSSQSNNGLIHSSFRNNWSQSLNIRSVSIATTIIILFVALVMHLRTTERLNHLSKNVECCQRDIRRLAGNKNRRQPNFKPNTACQAEAEIWRGKSSFVLLPVWLHPSGLLVWWCPDIHPVQLWRHPCSQVKQKQLIGQVSHSQWYPLDTQVTDS